MATAPAGWIRIVTVDVDAAVAFLSRTAVLAYAGDQAVHFRGQGGNGVIGRCGGLVFVTGGFPLLCWAGGGGSVCPRPYLPLSCLWSRLAMRRPCRSARGRRDRRC